MNIKIDYNRVNVDLGDRGYDITIGQNIVANVGELLSPIVKGECVLVVTDENVAGLHLASLTAQMDEAGFAYEVMVLPAGEATKSFVHYEKLMDWLLSHKPTRKSTLVAFGGGVIGDLTGYAAATLLRGVNFVQIPTTLLAMVDSSVGGKTGINSRYGKNLIGAFYQPKAVIADVDLLLTLPRRELLAGYAEVVKYAFINDVAFFEQLEKHTDVWNGYQLGERNAVLMDVLQEVVKHSCEAKADIVRQDEREGGVRALLNLGHTFGHAIEAELAFDGRVLHGEAVAIGMAMAFEFSVEMGICDAEDASKALAHMKKAGLHVDVQHIAYDFTADVLVGHMMHDKKNLNNKLVLILVKSLGGSYIHQDVDIEKVRQFINMWLQK